MLTADFQDLIENAAGFAGLDRENLDAGEFADLRGYANNRLRHVWGFREWDDLERTQQRWFRADYASGTYGAPTATTAVEVFDPATQLYYQSLHALNTDPPSVAGVENSAHWAVCEDEYSADDWNIASTYATAGLKVRAPGDYRIYQAIAASTGVEPGLPGSEIYWGLLTPFDRYVAYEQTGEDALGDLLHVTETNPKVDASARPIDFEPSENGVQIWEDVPFVWIHFRLRCPQLIAKAWDETLTYAVDRQVYFLSTTTPGNFYTVAVQTTVGQDPDDTPASFTLIELPRRFAAWLENGMAADWLDANDEPQKAAKYESLAQGFLEAEAIRHDNQNSRRLECSTR